MELTITISEIELEKLKLTGKVTLNNFTIQVEPKQVVEEPKEVLEIIKSDTTPITTQEIITIESKMNKPYILKYGKYIGQELIDAYKKDKDYIQWLITSIKDPGERELAILLITKYEKNNSIPISFKPKKITPQFTEDQIKSMKNLKDRLKITDNKELTDYVFQWSGGNLTKWQDITPSNVDKFLSYMNAEYPSTK